MGREVFAILKKDYNQRNHLLKIERQKQREKRDGVEGMIETERDGRGKRERERETLILGETDL